MFENVYLKISICEILCDYNSTYAMVDKIVKKSNEDIVFKIFWTEIDNKILQTFLC